MVLCCNAGALVDEHEAPWQRQAPAAPAAGAWAHAAPAQAVPATLSCLNPSPDPLPSATGYLPQAAAVQSAPLPAWAAHAQRGAAGAPGGAVQGQAFMQCL